MSRERRFSEPEVLDRLADAFALHGYGGTSLAQLQEATGLGKQSLYNSFGDKQSMYLQAIDCVVQRGAHVVAVMQAAPSGRVALDLYFNAMLDDCASDDPVRRNCIVTSGLLEGVDEAPLARVLTNRWHATHELLRAAIERGQRDGSIANPTPSAELAEMLTSLVSGLRVAARVGRDRAQMSRLVALTLGVLDMA
ncbi:TetR family transcriptional regulator [Hylemonella gracilis str. Niagara R]|uniref:TetR family transcriptional regulator n=1 Tax=Hylemonella gracilis str. Niagara R TaxID=1458275 RepID=A0A016XLD2_9BURK|nr:TetR/AcrR family transcriptional regulator [Hylemonella gracilis]EYC52626.1 TetR family transcriptional regulator [Hylemonella gracilis str. Niagara R]